MSILSKKPFFLENLQNSRESGRSLERAMVEKNGKIWKRNQPLESMAFLWLPVVLSPLKRTARRSPLSHLVDIVLNNQKIPWLVVLALGSFSGS